MRKLPQVKLSLSKGMRLKAGTIDRIHRGVAVILAVKDHPNSTEAWIIGGKYSGNNMTIPTFDYKLCIKKDLNI